MSNRKELYTEICNKDPEYDAEWDTVSAECKDFTQKLLTRNPNQRLTAEQALKHVWIANNLNVFIRNIRTRI